MIYDRVEVLAYRDVAASVEDVAPEKGETWRNESNKERRPGGLVSIRENFTMTMNLRLESKILIY